MTIKIIPMPAIQPAKLRMQAARLAELFDQPAALARALRGLLELYSDRTHRAGQSGEPPPLLASYNVPAPVVRQVLNELRLRARQDAGPTLMLCRIMWDEPYLEVRLAAASLLGMAPVEPPQPVLDLVNAWLHPLPEERLQAALLNQGMARLRQENPAALLVLSQEWLADPRLVYQQIALRALRGLAEEIGVDHLPDIFPLVTPHLRSAPKPLRPELLDLLAAMARRSPPETAFVLRQNLDAPDNPDTAWLIRQILDEFPTAQKESLKAAMKSKPVPRGA